MRVPARSEPVPPVANRPTRLPPAELPIAPTRPGSTPSDAAWARTQRTACSTAARWRTGRVAPAGARGDSMFTTTKLERRARAAATGAITAPGVERPDPPGTGDPAGPAGAGGRESAG